MVSIIMPVYNSEKYIGKAINSIINQTYADWELIVINDASEDKSLKIIEGYLDKRIKIIKNEVNMGVAISRNKGIQIASGRYIAFIDSDDCWKKNKLEKQINFMEKENIAFSFSAYERIKFGKKVKIVKVPVVVDYNEILKNTIILNSTVVLDTFKINKDIINMPNLKVGEDNATWFKILRNGIKAYGYNEVLTEYNIRKKSLSSNKIKNVIQMWQTYKQNEKLSFFKRITDLIMYIYNAIIKRI